MILTLGILILALIAIDALWTTFTLQGAGPLTQAICAILWRGSLRIPPPLRQKILPISGPLCLLSTICLWVLGLWLGWWLVFSAELGAVLHSQSGRPATGMERFYFTGYTVFTLGIGDFVPRGAAWLVCTNIASFTGLFLVTLSITYSLPVLSAATEKHQMGSVLRDLGESPRGILESIADRDGCSDLYEQVSNTLRPQLHLHAQRHRTYPVLHYFHSMTAAHSLPVNLVRLDDCLTILESAVDPRELPHPAKRSAARRSVAVFLEITEKHFHRRDYVDPPRLDWEAIHDSELTPLADEDIEKHVRLCAERRAKLYALLCSSGWEVESVRPEEPAHVSK